MQFVLFVSVAANRLFVPVGRAPLVHTAPDAQPVISPRVSVDAAPLLVQPVTYAAGPEPLDTDSVAVNMALAVAAGAGAAWLAPRAKSMLKSRVTPRSSGAIMQFGKKPTKSRRNRDGTVFDDEVDTTPNQYAWWNFEKSGSQDIESAGFAEGGRDLATDGLLIYAAFIPALLFAFLYFTGNTGDAYDAGNYSRR